MRAHPATGQLGEIGAAVIIEHGQLAVNNKSLGRQRCQCRDDQFMPTADIVAIAREQTRGFFTVADGEHAEAVVLYLEQPIIAVEWRRSALYNLKREVMRTEHATVFRQSRIRAQGPTTHLGERRKIKSSARCPTES